MKQEIAQPTKKRELALFLFLTIILFPILAIMAVAGYGLIVWIWQMFAGPPHV